MSTSTHPIAASLRASDTGKVVSAGEAVRLIEDRLRGLKMRVPVEGLRIKLVPDASELEQCRNLGEQLARHLTGQVEQRELDMAALV